MVKTLVPVLPLRDIRYMAAEYRIRSLALLLTFQKFTDKAVWHRFMKFVRDNLQEWAVKMWCARNSSNARGSDLTSDVVAGCLPATRQCTVNVSDGDAS